MDDPQPKESTSFKYEVLPDISHIRLARIHRSVPGQPLEVILTSAPITSATQMNYVALSYCWGDQTEKVPIICNGNNSRSHQIFTKHWPVSRMTQIMDPLTSGLTRCVSIRMT